MKGSWFRRGKQVPPLRCALVGMTQVRLEVQGQLAGHGARRDVVRAAEGGEEVVERLFVGQIDGRDLHAPFAAIAVKEVVVADSHIEEIAGLNAGRVMIVVAGTGFGNADQR